MKIVFYCKLGEFGQKSVRGGCKLLDILGYILYNFGRNLKIFSKIMWKILIYNTNSVLL